LLLGDTDRARSVFELAVNQPRLDMPELLWKQYIDFEVEQEEYDKARLLYKNLLSKTNHVKVWLSLAQFEIQTEEESQGSNISRWVEYNFRLRPSLLRDKFKSYESRLFSRSLYFQIYQYLRSVVAPYTYCFLKM